MGFLSRDGRIRTGGLSVPKAIETAFSGLVRTKLQVRAYGCTHLDLSGRRRTRRLSLSGLENPSRLNSFPCLADRARQEEWSYEDVLAVCLEREVALRFDHGGEHRIRAARFPAKRPSTTSTSIISAASTREVILPSRGLGLRPRQCGLLGPTRDREDPSRFGLSVRACQAFRWHDWRSTSWASHFML